MTEGMSAEQFRRIHPEMGFKYGGQIDEWRDSEVEAYAEVKVREHGKHVGQFLNDLYATMIDPCADGGIKVADMCEQLLKAARDNRQALFDVQAELAKLREERDALKRKLEGK